MLCTWKFSLIQVDVQKKKKKKHSCPSASSCNTSPWLRRIWRLWRGNHWSKLWHKLWKIYSACFCVWVKISAIGCVHVVQWSGEGQVRLYERDTFWDVEPDCCLVDFSMELEVALDGLHGDRCRLELCTLVTIVSITAGSNGSQKHVQWSLAVSQSCHFTGLFLCFFFFFTFYERCTVFCALIGYGTGSRSFSSCLLSPWNAFSQIYENVQSQLWSATKVWEFKQKENYEKSL